MVGFGDGIRGAGHLPSQGSLTVGGKSRAR